MFILYITIHIYDIRYAEQSSGDLIEIRCAFIDAIVWRTHNHT